MLHLFCLLPMKCISLIHIVCCYAEEYGKHRKQIARHLQPYKIVQDEHSEEQ